MRIIFSANNLFCRWLKLDLPRIPSPPEKQVGVESLLTNEQQLSIQLHAIRASSHDNNATVIAVEAYSRYAIIMPNLSRMSTAEFENELLGRWFTELSYLMVDSGALHESLLPMMQDQIGKTEFHPLWFKNTDRHVTGHVNDAAQWYKSALHEYNTDRLTMDQVFDLGLHVNKMVKNVKHGKTPVQQVMPITRFIDDGLFRFAKGLADLQFENTPVGDYPSPYVDGDFPAIIKKKTRPAKRARLAAVADEIIRPVGNVISMADYIREKKSRE